jgi:CRP-like cAMP-binding protein
MDKLEFLKGVDLFEGASEELITNLAEISEVQTFDYGHMVFDEGEKAEYVYVLIEGKVRVSISLTSQPARISVAMIEELGWVFGWSGIVAPYRYTAAATCEINSKVLAIPGLQFEELLMKEPKCGCTVMKKMAELISSRLRSSRMVLIRTL